MSAVETERKPRGFAALSPEKRRELSAKGGATAHANGTAHQWGRDAAQDAGSKGGKRAHALGRAHRFTHEEAVEAGRKGGKGKGGGSP